LNDAVWLVVSLRSHDASVVVMSTVSVPLFSRVPHSPLTLALPPRNGALNDAEAPVTMLLSSVAFVSVVPLRASSSLDVPDRISPVSEMRLVELALLRLDVDEVGEAVRRDFAVLLGRSGSGR
jgi:hypothetical protein